MEATGSASYSDDEEDDVEDVETDLSLPGRKSSPDLFIKSVRNNQEVLQGVPKKMVHSDFFTPCTVYEHATTREQLKKNIFCW